MKLNLIQERIQELFAIFVAEMKAAKAMNRGDINRISEVILLPLLSRCFGYANLENLNSAEYFNYPGVDLGDTTARVAVQVTSTSASKKVKETLAQFVDKELYKQYDRLIIFILTEKPRRPYAGKGYNQIIRNQFQFDKSRDIIDSSDLLKIIRFYQIDQAQEILQILEANIIGTKLRASSISPHDYNDVDPYLERTVCETKDAGPYSPYLLNDEQVLDLINVIEREGRVILLCDAGVGKSTELKRIAAFYSKAQSPFHADLIPLNKYVNQSIIEMLCPNWSAVPENGLLVILDGFDEIESQNRNNAVRQIEAFVERYPGVHVLISCRTNFYNKESEGFSGTLRRFSSYTLLDLKDTTINQHIMEELGKQGQSFMSRIDAAQLNDLLHSPFYLTRLIGLFAGTGQLPERKAQIFERLIQDSLQLDIEKFRTTESLIQKRAEIIETLERLALSMEVLGRNYLTDDEYREIESNPARRDLIQYCALWKKTEKKEVTWQFDQNTFQEYLAAHVLARQSLPAIKAFVSFEPEYPKLIPSWTNTLSFLVSIFDSGDPTFTELIQWIEAIEPEVIVRFETDKIPIAFRELYLQHIVEDYKKKEIVIDQEKFSYQELARFGQCEKTVRYLIDECNTAPNTATVINALRLLRHVSLPHNQRRTAAELFERYATDPSQIGYVRYLASLALSDQGLSTKEALDRVVLANGESLDEDVRHGLYYLLVNSRYLDDNVNVFLDGIVQAGGFGAAGSTSLLLEALRRAQKPTAVKLVLAHMKKHPGLWSGRTFRDSHINIIVENAVLVHVIDPTVFNDVLDILDAFLRRYRRVEAEELSAFFDRTETRLIGFEHTYRTRKTLPNQDHDWFELLAMLADEHGLKVFASEYAKGHLTRQDVWGFQGSLGSVKGGSLYRKFNAIINELSDNQFPLAPTRDRDAEEKEMASANFKLLFSKDAFINAVLQIFENERRKEFSTEQIEAIFMAGLQDGQKYSTLAIQSLREIAKSNGEIVQEDLAISCIEKGWEQVSVEHIYRYMEHDAEIVLTASQRDRLVGWCEAHLREVNFRTAIVVHKDGSWNTSAVGTKLWFFQRRLNLRYPEDVMLDMLSYENFDQSGLKGIEYFEDFLDPSTMTERVLENLEAGIESFYVLKNHLDYCRRQKLLDVIPFAQREIIRPLTDSFGRHEALATLISFPNVVTNLEQALPQITDGFKWPVLEELNKHGSSLAMSYLRDILAQGNEEERIRAAVYLMEREDIDGLRYYVDHAERSKQYPSGPMEKSPIRHFRSAEALPLIFRLLKLSYDPAILSDDQFSFLYNAVLDALNRIALASRENFQAVKTGIAVFIEQNKTTASNVKSLHFQLGRLERSYYTSVAQRLTLADVLVKVDGIFGGRAQSAP